MRSSKPAFCTFVKNSKPQSLYYEDTTRVIPRDNKHAAAVPKLDLKFAELEENLENDVPETAKSARKTVKSARRTTRKVKRTVPATSRNNKSAISPVIPDGPITPAEARAKYAALLNSYELEEIREYEEIYYLGVKEKKVKPNATGVRNFGFDDAAHHYRASIGDHIAYRYEIRAVLGKGAFGQVMKVFDHKTKKNVALKLIINTPQMHDQGQIEISLIQRLNEAPNFEDSHIIRGLDFFIFREHLCATFEILGLNLYDYSRKLRFKPMSSAQMRGVAAGMLKALAFMHENNVIHCDMKPENVLLIPNTTNDVKIIDFGSSCIIGKQRYEYIQSRFYRAPEVILGFDYGPPMDIWSFACIVAEMMTGRPLFSGDDESEQMMMYMEVLGAPSRELIEKAPRRKYFFTSDCKPIIPNSTKRRRKVGGSTLRLTTHISDALLIDLLSKCLEWDQDKRITAEEALCHPWFDQKESQTSRAFKAAAKAPRWR